MSQLDRLDPRTTALVVVDMQNDYCAPGGWTEKRGRSLDQLRSVIEPIQRVLAAARAAGLFVVHTRMVYDEYTFEDRRRRIVPKVMEGGSRRLCLRGSWGAEFIPELRPAPGERLVDKCRYSAFYNTDLEVALRGAGISSLVFTGVVTNVCVESTIRDAFFRDFDIVVLSDCVNSYVPELHRATLQNVELLFGAVVLSEEATEWLRCQTTTRTAGAAG